MIVAQMVLFIVCFIMNGWKAQTITTNHQTIKHMYTSRSPWNNPRKKSRSLIFIFTLFTWLFSPLATNMGPYGPVWTRMDPYIIIYCFYVIYTLFLHCVYIVFIWFSMVFFIYIYIYMFWHLFHIFWKLILHIFITFLDNSKDHFCSPPAPKFAL